MTAAGITAITVAFIGAAATFIVGLLNYRLQKNSKAHEIKLVRSAQATDRFTRAIEQLGSEKAPVRMGGIFALERMARDSPGDRMYIDDRMYIVDALAAFIRGRLDASTVGEGGYVRNLQLRAPDAQAALTVLCRSPLSDERVNSGNTGLLDLSHTDLRRANLRDARLDGAILYAARLEGADLRGAHMENSNLDQVNFGRFDPRNESFRRGADLRNADLTGAWGRAYNLDVALTEGTVGLQLDRA